MKNKKIFYFIIFMFFSIGFTKVVTEFFSNSARFYRETDFGITEDAIIGGIENGQTVLQSFEMPYDTFKGVGIKFGTYNRINNGKLTLRLKQQDMRKSIYVWNIKLSDIADNQVYSFSVKDGIQVERGGNYILELISYNESSEDSVTVYSSMIDVYDKGDLSKGDVALDRDLCFLIKGSDIRSTLPLYIFNIILFAFLFLIISNIVQEPYLNYINKNDKIVTLLIILFLSILFMQYGDIAVIIKNAEFLLDCIKSGNVLNFYKYSLENASWVGVAPNYNIIAYLIIALIIWPLEVIETVFKISVGPEIRAIYINIIIGIAFCFSGELIKKLALSITNDDNTSSIVKYIYLISPIMLFSTVGFCQLDIFCVIFTVISLIFYSKKRYHGFAFSISIAILLKSFPVLIFVPLILLIEKRILVIGRYFIEGLGASLVFYLLYGRQFEYIYIQEWMEKTYGFTSRIFDVAYPSAYHGISLFVALWCLVCFWCYYQECNELWKQLILIPVMIYSMFAALVAWHPQYLAIYAPFLALAIIIVKNKNRYLGLLTFLSLGHLGITFLTYIKNVDNYMFNYGILSLFFNMPDDLMTIREILESLEFEYLFITVVSLFVASVLAVLFVIIADAKLKKNAEQMPKNDISRGYTLLPLIPLFAYIMLSSTMCLTL